MYVMIMSLEGWVYDFWSEWGEKRVARGGVL